MERTDFPFVKCLNPIYSINKYNGEKILAPCGHCKACLLQRSRKMSMLCSQEEQHHKYTYFVTLTYDMQHMPKMKLICNSLGDIVSWKAIDKCKRSDTFNEVFTVPLSLDRGKVALLMSKITSSWKHWNEIYSQHNYFGYANRRDLVLFMKRLRKRITQQSNESIRFYAVSEYGPRTFRPHFHILLFFDDERTLQSLQKNISASWPYGRIDCSLSRGKCSSYVAQYVNSSVSLPQLFAFRPVKPFCAHSVFFGTEFYKSQKKELYKLTPKQFIQQSCVINGRYVTFSPWRSFTLIFYPKCKGFSSKSYSKLLYAYTLLPTLQRAFKRQNLKTPSQIAKELMRLFVSSVEEEYFNFEDDISFFAVCKALKYFKPSLNLLNETFNGHSFEENFKSCFDSICSELYVSRHFVNFCCDNNESRYSLMVSKIYDFYKDVDYIRMTQFYEDIQEFSKEHPFEVKYMYATFVPESNLHEYKKTDFYLKFYAETLNDIAKSTKHKELNDLNKIFIID